MHKIQLTTTVKIPMFDQKLHFDDEITFLGSCFTENIGLQLKKLKMNALVNPFGIIYNPKSLAKSVRRIINREFYSENELSTGNDLWFSYDHHGRFSHPSKEKCLENINTSMEAAREHIKQSRIVFITLGTAGVYVLKGKDEVVANCHKMPADIFHKKLLSSREVKESLLEIIKDIRKLNSNAKFVFSLSPVRHIRDGLIENGRSKANLLSALHEVCEADEHYYFPAYEVLLDELRDYRFFADDLVHPSDKAIDMIRMKFYDTFLLPKAKEILEKVNKLKTTLEHRPFYPQSDASQKLKNSLLGKMDKMEEEYPFISFSEEKKLIEDKKG